MSELSIKEPTSIVCFNSASSRSMHVKRKHDATGANKVHICELCGKGECLEIFNAIKPIYKYDF